MDSSIIFHSININQQGPNAGVFIGDTNALGWDTHNKIQMSVGKIYSAFGAFSSLPGNWYALSDNDFWDMFIQDTDKEGGANTSNVGGVQQG